MVLARVRKLLIKNTRVVCRTSETPYGVLPHLFRILSCFTLLITLFIIAIIKCSVCLYINYPDTSVLSTSCFPFFMNLLNRLTHS